MNRLPLCAIFLLALALSACTTPMMLAPSGSWDANVRALGPVEACRGGTVDSGRSCGQWPLSIAMMPGPESHYVELRTKAMELYQVDYDSVVLKDVHVVYSTEINGVIRGWRATADE
jgi:hypothetical protein